MRKTIFITSLVVGLILIVSACNPDGTEIGDLYGRWHLKSVVCNQGEIEHNDTLFLSFQGNTYQYQAQWGHFDWGSYRLTADSLQLNPLAKAGTFAGMGLNLSSEDSVIFKLQTLTDKDMVICRNDSIWTFRKFL